MPFFPHLKDVMAIIRIW